jgi:hypothetical protein
VPAAPPTDIFRQPEPEPPPMEEPPMEEPPPPGDAVGPGLVSTRNASPSAAILDNPRALLASFRTERSAESGGGERPRGERAPAAVRLWLEPGRREAAPGEVFEVIVQAAAGRPVSHLPVTLTYDPALLAVQEVRPGAFLGGAGQAQVLADASRPGEIVLGASRMGEVPAVSGQGELARITFRAVARGTARIRFSRSQALDAALRPVLPLRSSPATIEVRGRNTGPGDPVEDS